MKKQNGITLIALVITIIVLIILAGVAINLTLGDNGILKRAENARELSNKATVKEKVELAIVEVQVEEVTSTGRLTLQKLYETLESKDSNITLNEYAEGDTELTGTYTLNGKTYSFTINNKFEVETGDAEEVAAKPIKFGELVWNADGTVGVDATTELAGNIEYQVNGTDGEWKTGSLPTNLQVGDKLYVRVNDGTNVTEPQEIEIKDTVLPEEFEISVPAEDITYESLKITSEGTEDKQTGIENYTFVVTKDGTAVKEIKNQTVTEYEIQGLSPETEYVVYMLAYDKSGNVRKSNEVTVTTPAIPAAKTYGQYVNYGIDLNDDGDTTNDWMIFYKEEGDVNPDYTGATYIIAAEPVSHTKISQSISNAGMATRWTGEIYGIYWDSAPNTFVKNSNYDDVKAIFMHESEEETKLNSFAVSRLLDTTAWESDLVTNELRAKGGMAIGGPTVKMWVESWNKSYPTQKINLSLQETGYTYNGTNNLNLSSCEGYSSAPNLYFPIIKQAVSNGRYCYWLASQAYEHLDYRLLAGVHYDGRLCSPTVYQYNNELRPLVYIPSSVTLTPDATTPNLWNINY